MIKRTFIALGLISFLLASACNQPGVALVRFEAKGLARLSQAPTQGQYALYEKNVSDPDVTYTLAKGDKLGFVQSDGKTYAVAGSHKDELKPDKGYFWRQIEE